MIILKMWGGLGNQMFIYALYRSMCHKGIEAKIDMSWFNYYNAHNGYELSNLFGVKIIEATEEEVKRYAIVKPGKVNGLLRKTIYRNSQILLGGHDAITYHPEVFKMTEKYLAGYWQSENYFIDIKDSIRKEFEFPLDLRLKDNQFFSLVRAIKENANTVSIHVRRGDYISDNKSNGFTQLIEKAFGETISLGNVCDREYYEKAIKYINNAIERPHYYIFSNDMDWCKENIPISSTDMTFIEVNKGVNSFWDMYLMSQCRHNIIANSSFSWWGAWLNSNIGKIVVAPDRWFQDGYIGDIIPTGWVTLPTK